MSADDFLADAATRRQVMVQRVSRGITSELEGLLEEMREEIVGRISDAGTEFQRARLGSLLSSVDSIISGKAEAISESLREQITEFTSDELDFQKQTLDQVIDGTTAEPNADQVLSAVTGESTSLVQGDQKQSVTIEQMVGVLAGANRKELKNVISAGFIAGDTTSQITQRVSQKIRGRSRAQVRAVVQTSLNHAASVARQKFAERNKDILGGEKYVATLDSSTTVTCAGLDGNIYEVGVGPRPPLHYNCRSLRVAVPREDSVLSGLEGTRPAVGAEGVEQVSSRKTFSGWLGQQPAEFKREFFGKFKDGDAKYKLFEQGGLDAKDFIDPDGVAMSLQELREKNPLAWQRANIEQ
jgi:SPP1 gp7 family putative phage head morphogenesis protein